MAQLGHDQERSAGETAWTVLDAANDLGDTLTVDACRRVIDADLRGEAPARPLTATKGGPGGLAGRGVTFEGEALHSVSVSS